MKVLRDILRQCRVLDTMHVTKEEMHRPLKHVIVGKKVVLLDFERARYDEFPKNVTQFCQFLISGVFSHTLVEKEISFDKEKMMPLLKRYKADQSKKNFKHIARLL